MCGIAGYVSTSETFDPRLSMTLALLGVFMEERGRQSWGYSDGERIIKRVGSFRSGGGPGLFGSTSAILHTRQATTGEKTAENAHPFDIKGIIGCHNGMIFNHKAVGEKFGIEYKVDSELIFHLLADGTALTELEGYGTIAFYQNDKMHLGRFSNRGDLALAKTELGWVFASTKEAVEDSTGIAGIKVDSWADTALGKLYQLDGDNLVVMPTSLEISNMKSTAGASNWQDFRHNGSEGYQAGAGTFGGGYNYYSRGHWDSKLQKWIDDTPTQLPLPTAETTTFSAEPESDADEVIDVSDDAYMEAARALSGRSTLEGSFSSKDDFLKTTPNEFMGGSGGVACDECVNHIGAHDDLFVEMYSETFVCGECFDFFFYDINEDADVPPETPTGEDFTKDVIAEMTRCSLLNSGTYGLEDQPF